MEIGFSLGWVRGTVRTPFSARKVFKQEGAALLFSEYLERIGFFHKTEISGALPQTPEHAMKIWLCEPKAPAKVYASEDLARELEKMRQNAVKKLVIGIGGPDGFDRETVDRLHPDRGWSFGPMTLPHELAAVVAAEQIYRALTILHKLPYHTGH